jgi:hypothetical protein
MSTTASWVWCSGTRHLSDVHDGMHMWMKSRAGTPGFLSKVTAVVERSDLIEVQLLNTTSDKRVGQWKLSFHFFRY